MEKHYLDVEFEDATEGQRVQILKKKRLQISVLKETIRSLQQRFDDMELEQCDRSILDRRIQRVTRLEMELAALCDACKPEPMNHAAISNDGGVSNPDPINRDVTTEEDAEGTEGTSHVQRITLAQIPDTIRLSKYNKLLIEMATAARFAATEEATTSTINAATISPSTCRYSWTSNGDSNKGWAASEAIPAEEKLASLAKLLVMIKSIASQTLVMNEQVPVVNGRSTSRFQPGRYPTSVVNEQTSVVDRQIPVGNGRSASRFQPGRYPTPVANRQTSDVSEQTPVVGDQTPVVSEPTPVGNGRSASRFQPGRYPIPVVGERTPVVNGRSTSRFQPGRYPTTDVSEQNPVVGEQALVVSEQFPVVNGRSTSRFQPGRY